MTNRECYELISREGPQALYYKGYTDGRKAQILRSCSREVTGGDIALNTLKDFRTMLEKKYCEWMESKYNAKAYDVLTYLEEIICSRENG